MSEPGQIRALAQLRESLHEAARREMAARRRRPRWAGARMRRGAVVLVATLLAAAAAAGAASLLSTGHPVREGVLTGRYLPTTAGERPIAVIAADRAAATRWGVSSYTARSGEACAVVGQVRGTRLGAVRDGVFHPYTADSTGVCGNVSRGEITIDLRRVREPSRSLVYGRAGAGTRRVHLLVGGERYAAPVSGGAYLFVFDGQLAIGDIARATS